MTTSLQLPHKQPTRNPVFLRTSYYGSMGRPSNGRRKSAVELLQESKAFYVKSESVLDTKQELKNADHLHVRSPTSGGEVSSSAAVSPPSSSAIHYRHVPTNVEGHILPIFPLGTCPPYPHHHFDQEDRSKLEREFEQLIGKQLAVAKRSSSSGGEKRSAAKSVAGGESLLEARQLMMMMKNNGKDMLKSNGLGKGVFLTGGKGGSYSNNKHSSGRSASAAAAVSNKTGSLRRTALPPETLQLHIKMQPHHDGVISLDGSHIVKGLPVYGNYRHHQYNSSSSRNKEKYYASTLPLISSNSASSAPTHPPAIPSHGNGKKVDPPVKLDDNDSPPPLPPKSPRTSSKPARPQDFPQRLPLQGVPDIQPPPPPRRLISQENDHYHEGNVQVKLRRLLHDGPSVKNGTPAAPSTALLPPTKTTGTTKTTELGSAVMGPITLPSPILPPTPPPDITMESPMSDSGPIISPPPAFSTPVTPMLDRQNSSASEKSSQRHQPLSAAMSMVSVSISSVSSGGRNSRKSIPDLSDVSMRYSPRSGSSSSPIQSPDDNEDADDADDDDDGDDDEGIEAEDEDEESTRRERLKRTRTKSKTKHSSVILHKKILPKSITENALHKVSNLEVVNPHWVVHHQQQQQPLPQPPTKHNLQVDETGVPARRPILRSKSDLSHRYIKSGNSANLISGGFTLVQVDLGVPPPLPPHGSASPAAPLHKSYNSSSNVHHLQQQQHYHHHSHQPSSGTKFVENNYSNVGPTIATSTSSPPIAPRRASRSSVELERFFDKLGLDNTTTASPPPTTSGVDRSATSSPVFFSSVSSVDSGPRRGGSVDSGDSPNGVKFGSRTVGGAGYNNSTAATAPAVPNSTSSSNLVIQHGEPSIVERNARVIKWLFNCKKALDTNKR